MTGRVCVGTVAGAFGTGGEVRLKSFCGEPEAIAGYGPLSTEDGARDFAVQITRPVKGGFAATLSGVATREAAEALNGTRLYAAREALPALPADEFYHADLVGLDVRDTGGVSLGRVQAVHNHGATDLLEVGEPGSRGTMLLAFTEAEVPTVDLEAGVLVADPPESAADA